MPVCPNLPDVFFAFSSPEPGFFYARQISSLNELWFYAEARDAEWAYVFRGELSSPHGHCQWKGEYFAVPKGRRCDNGELVLEVTDVFATTPPSAIIRRVNEVAGFPSSLRTGFTSDFLTATGELAPGFQGFGLDNITGKWMGDDRGIYYINEVPETGQVVWFGEHPAAEPSVLEEARGEQWANVMIGRRSGDVITGRWADVPRGLINQDGLIRISIIDGANLAISEVSGGFGGRNLVRVGGADGVADIECEVSWFELTVVNQQDRRGVRDRRGDEVSLHVAISKMDGETVDFSNLAEASSIVTAFDTGEILDLQQGETGSLAGVQTFRSQLTPVRNAPATRTETVLAISVRGVERDRKRVVRVDDMQRSIKDRVDRSLRRGEPLDVASAASVVLYRGRPFPGGHDDVLGTDTIEFNWGDLMEIASFGTRRLEFTVRGQGGEWRIVGTLRVDARMNASCSKARGR